VNHVSLDEAISAVRGVAPAPRPARVPLERAHGRVAATPLVSRTRVPNVDVAAMDGYACRAEDTGGACSDLPVRLRLVGSSAAGEPFVSTLGPGEAVAVATGAVVPDGANAIAVVERARLDGEQVWLEAPAARKHVRHAGEDVERGVEAFTAGVTFDALRLALAVSLGHADAEVVRRPVVAVLTTGPELAPPGSDLAPGEVHDSNGLLVTALLRALGAEARTPARVADEESALRRALDLAQASASGETAGPDLNAPDLIVTTGGASVGRYDVVRQVLESDGGLLFGGVRVRPGRPTALGRWRGTPWLALPGTPHAVALLGTVLLGSWAHVATGRAGEPPCLRRELAECDLPLPAHAERTVLRLARSSRAVDGRLQVTPLERGGDSRLVVLGVADALIVMPPGADVQAGSLVEVVPLRAPGGLLAG